MADHPDRIAKINASYFRAAEAPVLAALGTTDKQHAIASIAIVGTDDTELTENFQAVQNAFYIDGVDVQVAGQQAVRPPCNRR